ncbi:MAG: hypothetical protein KCHDKBKB_01207 [Elusimicrobia bacterium]|nr:hypothetical protein [Elusimicrobiota bacterium]
MKHSNRKYWWTQDLSRIQFCFVCGGGLSQRLVPAEGKRRLVCKVCFHITYLNPKSVAGLLPILPDGRIVLLRRSIEPGYGKWSYPAGYQEMGESVDKAAVRETFEEIVAKVRIRSLLGVYSYPASGVVTTVFVGEVPRSQKPRPGEEALEVGFFSPNVIPWKDLAFQSTVDALKDWVKQK